MPALCLLVIVIVLNLARRSVRYHIGISEVNVYKPVDPAPLALQSNSTRLWMPNHIQKCMPRVLAHHPLTSPTGSTESPSSTSRVPAHSYHSDSSVSQSIRKCEPRSLTQLVQNPTLSTTSHFVQHAELETTRPVSRSNTPTIDR